MADRFWRNEPIFFLYRFPWQWFTCSLPTLQLVPTTFYCLINDSQKQKLSSNCSKSNVKAFYYMHPLCIPSVAQTNAQCHRESVRVCKNTSFHQRALPMTRTWGWLYKCRQFLEKAEKALTSAIVQFFIFSVPWSASFF